MSATTTTTAAVNNNNEKEYGFDTTNMCQSCAERQNQLLEDNDGSLVICECLLAESPDSIMEDEEEEEKKGKALAASAAAAAMPVPSSFSASTNNSRTKGKKRRRRTAFPSLMELASQGDDRIKRKVSPIVSWDTLKERNVYLVVAMHEMDCMIKGEMKMCTYAHLETDDDNDDDDNDASADCVFINVWLTDYMKEELEKQKLKSRDVYIIPLGKTKSKRSGHDYNDFVVIKGRK